VKNKETVSNKPINMSQRALRGRTVDIVSEEMDLGSREKSPDLEELETEGFRPDVNEVNKEAKDSQSVLDVEVPDLQTGSSDKDQNSKGEKTPSSEMTMVMNMIQQQFLELNEGVKQAQEKADQQFQELKNGQKQAQEGMKEGQKQLKVGLQKDINQVLLECRKSRELLKQELSEKLSAEI
jgi:hypothetical protein